MQTEYNTTGLSNINTSLNTFGLWLEGKLKQRIHILFGKRSNIFNL